MQPATRRARELRVNQTNAEKRLWKYLRNRQLEDHKFHRQFSIPPYFVDFVCRDKKLIVEIDGGQHAENKADIKRTHFLEGQGYKVIRFWNNDILENTEGVLSEILATLNTLTPTLSLKREGGINLENTPDLKEEAWKYTDLSRAIPDGLVAAKDKPVVIHRTCEQNGDKPVELLWTGERGTYHAPQLEVILAERAELTLIEHFSGEKDCWLNMTADFDLGKNSRLTHIRLFDGEGAGTTVTTATTRIAQNTSSSYSGFYIMLKSGFCRNEMDVELNGEEAECAVSGVTMLGDEQHGDNTITMHHKAPDCTSSQFFRHVLNDRARGVFQAKAIVYRGADGTDVRQMCNALLLSEGTEMDSKPELEIYADDVKCAHGATIGQLDEDALFYLRSRGMDDETARSLLIEAFINEVVDRFVKQCGDKFVEERLGTYLNNSPSRLREGEQKGEGI